MNEPKKAPPTMEQSLNYIAWHLKDIKEDIRLIVTNLANQTSAQEQVAPRQGGYRDEKLPF